MSATIKVDIRQLPHAEGLALPAYQSADAAGMDLLAAVPMETPLILAPGKYAMVPTGLTIALPRGFEAQVRPRSGLALRCTNTRMPHANAMPRSLTSSKKQTSCSDEQRCVRQSDSMAAVLLREP